MLTDLNKSISSNIIYNHLNLPTNIDLSGGNISYIYDATGVKLEKKVTENGNDTYSYYAGNYVYITDNTGSSLKFFNQPEGYVEPNGSSFDYVYQYKDHLGNVRLSYADSDGNGSIDASTEIISENSYYPFGMAHSGYNNVVSANANSQAEKIKYNGKELEEELGKDTYAYGWRDYDPAIGRFNKIDRFAEKYVNLSTYSYAGNNPVIFVDIQGDSIGLGKNYFNKFKNSVESKIASEKTRRGNRIKRLNKRGKTDKVNDLQKKWNKADADGTSSLAVYEETLTELNAMESSTDVLYDIKMNVSAGNKNAGGFLGYDTSRNSVTVNLTGSYNQGDLAHELKHGHQFLEGKISIYSVKGRSYGGDLYDVQDEVEAYNRGHFFGSINSSVSEIQKNYPSLKGKLTQKTLQNTSVAPTVTKRFIISGVPTGLITVPHHYHKK